LFMFLVYVFFALFLVLSIAYWLAELAFVIVPVLLMVGVVWLVVRIVRKRS
jgi:hypothetical protein